jgi:hypothetical protein
MERQAKPTCAIVAVEGGTDKRLLAKFSVTDRCRFVIANGKVNVVGALNILDQEDIEGILGVVDNDFDSILGRRETSPNIVDSFLHDIEIVMFTSCALDHVMAERADPARFTFSDMEDFRRFLLERTRPLSYLRLISLRAPYDLDFDGLKFRFVSPQLRIDEQRLIEMLVSRTENCRISRSDLLKALQSAAEHGDLDRCRQCGVVFGGSDLVNFHHILGAKTLPQFILGLLPVRRFLDPPADEGSPVFGHDLEGLEPAPVVIDFPEFPVDRVGFKAHFTVGVYKSVDPLLNVLALNLLDWLSHGFVEFFEGGDRLVEWPRFETGVGFPFFEVAQEGRGVAGDAVGGIGGGNHHQASAAGPCGGRYRLP